MSGNDKTDASVAGTILPRPIEQSCAESRESGGPTSDETALRLSAREAIQWGRLPARRAKRAASGPGLGGSCKVCGWPVAHADYGFEVEFDPDPDDCDAFGSASYELHVPCYAAWELERRNFRVFDGVLPTEPDHGTISNREHDTTNTRGAV